MAGSTLEQLKAWWTPARKSARDREDRRIAEHYPKRYVAFVDEWDGEELVRTVVGAASDLADFVQLQLGLAPDVRQRLRVTDTHRRDELTVGSAFFE